MLIKNKKTFSTGVVFAVTFLGVLLLIFSNVFDGKNGLQYSDESFNRLAKGSSYFIPKVTKTAEKYKGQPLSVRVALENPNDAEATRVLFEKAGAAATVAENELQIEGDMGSVLLSALGDADAMYKNEGKAVADRYGYDEKTAMRNWWMALSKIEKSLKKEKKVAEAKAVSDVMKKGVEPAYNFYHVDAQKVADHAGMMTGLLVFYVAYTMWWGFAIYYLFDGIGLTMKKAKVKKEA